MATEVQSLLAIDIGATNTKVNLFDIVGGRYRFISYGEAPSTAGAPLFDIGEGIWEAIAALERKSHRKIISEEGALIAPSTPENTGVDLVVATMSAGKPLKVLAVGLQQDVSLQAAEQLAATTYARVVDTISLNDRRSESERINLIAQTRPEVILMAGGTNDGASRSLLNLIEVVGLASYLQDESHKPHVLYTGNEELHSEVKSSLSRITDLHLAPNILPLVGSKSLYPAQKEYFSIFKEVRKKQSSGISQLLSWTNGQFASSATAISRVVRFLSKKYEPDKGVLGVDLGSQSTVFSAAFDGEEALRVFPYLGMGTGSPAVLERSSLGKITRWLPTAIPETRVEDYLHQKYLYPASVPTEPGELALEHALARQVLRIAVKEGLKFLPDGARQTQPDLLPLVEPIIGSGKVLTEAPSRAHSTLILLDGLQPTGVTTLALDQNGLLPALGAVSPHSPLLAVQVIESSTFLNLGTVIAPVGYARPGTPILRMQIQREDGRRSTREIKYGSLMVLPTHQGEKVTLHLRPLHGFDVGMGGPGRSGRVSAVGGALGVIIDARGRPLQFSSDPERNQKRNQQWLKILQKFE